MKKSVKILIAVLICFIIVAVSATVVCLTVFKKSDSGVTTEQPEDNPDDGKDETPDDGKDEKPDDGKDEKPDDGKDEKPDDGKDETPDDGKDEKPDDGKDEKPDDGKDDKPDDPPDDNKKDEKAKIVLSGIGETFVMQGTFFDCFEGVTAVDGYGTDFTDSLTASGEVNTSVAGDYTVTYSVADKDGELQKFERSVSVTQNPSIGKVKPTPLYSVSNGTYNIAKGCAIKISHPLTDSKYAVDGDMSTRIESAHGVDEVRITVDLGAKLSVEQIRIFWEAAYAESFALLYSDDGEEWQNHTQISDQNLEAFQPNVFLNEFANLSFTARYVRLNLTKRHTNYGYSIWELQIFGKQGTVIPKEEYPELFDAEKEGSPDWAVEDYQVLTFDLGTVKSVDSVRIAYADYLTPKSYRLSYSADNSNFTEVKIENLPYSADTFGFTVDNIKNSQVTARYFKLELIKRRFFASSYRITEVEFKLGAEKHEIASASASSQQSEDYAIEKAFDGKSETFWQSECDRIYKTVDLKKVCAVGRVDIYWRGDDGGKGKYYDLQISSDGVSFTTVFRQTHGATQLQSVFVYENARYIRIIDYQNTSDYIYMLEGMVVHSQYPLSSGEGKVEYDLNEKLPETQVIKTENGSYITGGTDFPSARLIAYLDEDLRNKPVPSNDWWQGLLVKDKGYNMFMNPLTATFTESGLYMTNHGEGYFDGLIPGNGSQTVAVDEHDISVGYSGMDASSKVYVTGYSDYGIKCVMTDDRNVDRMTVFLSQGSLYAYCIFAEPEKAQISAQSITKIFSLDGEEILSDIGNSHIGDGIVVCVRTLASFEGGVRKYRDNSGEHENARIYEDRFYVVSTPADTKFIRNESGISVIMTGGNYLSLGAASYKKQVSFDSIYSAQFPEDEVGLLHEHAYAFVTDTLVTYSFDGQTNTVTTEFSLYTVLMRNGYSKEAYTAYMPHHLAKSDYTGGKIYKSIRGDCRSFAGNSFVTKDTFYGVVPTFTEPTNSEYSSAVLYDQLLKVYNGNGGDKLPEDSNLISGDPYWQGKNLHPMAMAAIAADQIGATDLRDKFLDKIEYILVDWFNYDPVADEKTGAYFYYDGEWGTLYYRNSEFGAGVNLADHYFTYGYYLLASGVLTSYRPQFAEKYGDMVELLIRDYMNPNRDDSLFPYMRNFDMFAGHGWAGGYADNNGGNNQESAGEALNSWVGAYLYATAVGNEEVRIAAIYGYTTELAAIKHYWFNYFNDFAESYAYGVAGQVYGGSNFYGTFFNGQPLYMYGIHLIPGEEYLTSYALNASERQKLENLIDNMRKEQAMWDVPEEQKTIHGWQHIFIPVVAIYDPDEALSWYDEQIATKGNVGNDSEQFNVYWLINGMKSHGLRTTDIYAENGATATVYKNGGSYNALCWNPTGETVKITFRNSGGVTGYALVPARSLVTCDPLKNTESFTGYKPADEVKLEDAVGAAISGGELVLNGGKAEYLLSFGTVQNYRRLKVSATGDISLKIDGKEVALSADDGGYVSVPLMLTFKHTVELSGNGKVTSVGFETLKLAEADVNMTATASSENGQNTADKAVDDDISTRWESIHGSDNEWLEIVLDEAVDIYRMSIVWEAASAKEYKVYFSSDGENFKEAYFGSFSSGARTDIISPTVNADVKYIRIEGISRTTNYGYSIYGIKVFNFG